MSVTTHWTIDFPSPIRLLVVEDSNHDMLAVKRTLDKDTKEWDVKYADSVTSALKELETESHIDIVLTDYNLNGPNGLDLCEIILAKHQDVTVILLTGTGSEAIAADALRLGVGDYLIKDPMGGYLDLLPEALLNAWRRQNESRLLQEHLHQSQRLEAMGQLTGGVAHDFNNMLAIMIGNIELLEQEIPATPGVQKRIDNLKEIIDRAASLTQRLLAFSSQQPLLPTTTDIVLLFDDLKDMLVGTLGETIDLTIIASSDLWKTHIDGSQLDHVLINLALNARDAMSDGGSLIIEAINVIVEKSFTTQLSEVTTGDYVKISVSDSGEGMTSDVLKKIFEPFFTTKNVGEGSGLGLSMVYGFVKQSGGHIMAESKPGQGTTITIYLPGSDKPPVINSTDTSRLERPTKERLILVVEDEPGVRDVAVTFLRHHGFEVSEAKDAEEAIALLQNEPSFDLLFTDVILPGDKNGVELAAEAALLVPKIKVLFTSGHSRDALIHDGKLIDGLTLIPKPYRSAVLIEMVQSLLDDVGADQSK